MFDGLVHANPLKLSENNVLFYRVRGAYLNRGDQEIRYFVLDDSKVTHPDRFAAQFIAGLISDKIVLGFWEEEYAEMKCRGQVEHHAISEWQATSPLHVIQYSNTAIFKMPTKGKMYALFPCRTAECDEALRVSAGFYILLNPGYQVVQAKQAL
jgi:hypothetical protein